MAFDFKSDPNYNKVLQTINSSAYSSFGQGLGQQNINDFTDQVNGLGDTFSNLFKTFVGRDPTANEQQQFVQQYVQPNATKLTNGASAMVQDPYTYLNQYISNTFQPQAKAQATQQLQDQQGQATSLADQYRSMGQQSIDSTSKYLQDYQSQLFNRLQPQIITSLQSQGLLNTGGLNEAMAGAQKDLAAQAQGYLADANLQMNNQANQIQFGGAAAPYQYQQSLALNQLPYLQSQGQQAMGQGYNTFLNNMNFENQLNLQNNAFNKQLNNQPSMLGTLGTSFAGSFGNNAGQWGGPQAYQSSGSGKSGASGLMSLFG